VSYFLKSPSVLTEQECYDALKDPKYNRALSGEVTQRIVELTRVRNKREDKGAKVIVKDKASRRRKRPVDVRMVKYTARHTWQDFKGKVAAGAVGGAAVFDWLDARGLLPELLPFNSVIFWALFLAGGAVLIGIAIIHLLEERDIKIERGR
jgi:hypothetical protein